MFEQNLAHKAAKSWLSSLNYGSTHNASRGHLLVLEAVAHSQMGQAVVCCPEKERSSSASQAGQAAPSLQGRRGPVVLQRPAQFAQVSSAEERRESFIR